MLDFSILKLNFCLIKYQKNNEKNLNPNLNLQTNIPIHR